MLDSSFVGNLHVVTNTNIEVSGIKFEYGVLGAWVLVRGGVWEVQGI